MHVTIFTLFAFLVNLSFSRVEVPLVDFIMIIWCISKFLAQSSLQNQHTSFWICFFALIASLIFSTVCKTVFHPLSGETDHWSLYPQSPQTVKLLLQSGNQFRNYKLFLVINPTITIYPFVYIIFLPKTNKYLDRVYLSTEM